MNNCYIRWNPHSRLYVILDHTTGRITKCDSILARGVTLKHRGALKERETDFFAETVEVVANGKFVTTLLSDHILYIRHNWAFQNNPYPGPRIPVVLFTTTRPDHVPVAAYGDCVYDTGYDDEPNFVDLASCVDFHADAKYAGDIGRDGKPWLRKESGSWRPIG